MEEYHELDKNAVRKRYGISNETFQFYVSVGLIKKHNKKGLFLVSIEMDSMYLEKNTVFKYCFDDSWQDDLKSFSEKMQFTSKVKVFSEEEKRELEKKYLLKK